MHLHSTTVALCLAAVAAAVECPGVVSNSAGTNESYCCVGGELSLSNCPGWPICSGPTTFNEATATPTCATTIPVTASNYGQLIASASSQYLDSSGSILSTAAGQVTATGGGDISSTSTSSDANGTARRTAMTLLAPAWAVVFTFAACL